MRPLAWLLIRCPSTLSLAGLERALAGELRLRATCACSGQPSPHQLPPGAFAAIALALAAAGALWLGLRHLAFII